MKNLLILLLFVTSGFLYSQDIVATTSDGKKVLLKPNKTWEYSGEIEIKRKITMEFTSKDPKRQFQVIYDDPSSEMSYSGNQINGFYNSGWKKSIYITKMENQITLKVATSPMGAETVTLNLYIDDKLVKTITEKAKNLIQGPATLTIDLADYK